MKKLLILLSFVAFAFAAEAPVVPSSEAIAADSTATAVDSSVAVVPDSSAAVATGVDSEIALRDSLIAVKDSVNAAEKQAMQTKLDIESARCGNWEQSYVVLDSNFQTCTKMLRVYAETAEKKTEQLNEVRSSSAMAQSTSFVGGVLIGILVGWLIWD